MGGNQVRPFNPSAGSSIRLGLAVCGNRRCMDGERWRDVAAPRKATPPPSAARLHPFFGRGMIGAWDAFQPLPPPPGAIFFLHVFVSCGETSVVEEPSIDPRPTPHGYRLLSSCPLVLPFPRRVNTFSQGERPRESVCSLTWGLKITRSLCPTRTGKKYLCYCTLILLLIRESAWAILPLVFFFF